MPTRIFEAAPFAQAATPAEGPGRLLVKLIDAGKGSSGVYTAEALQLAAQERVFPAGTHMYIDHPTETEQWERPERSVKDLAAVLVEDARYDAGMQALVAEVRVFSQWRQPIAEMMESIGTSIRAMADTEPGEWEGRPTKVITRLLEALSVDFVTHAGRGGKILQVLESDRRRVHEARNVGQWVEARIHRDFTTTADEMFGDGRLTREERITLSGAIGDALAAFVARLEADAPQLYQRDLWDEPPMASAQAVEAAVRRGVAEATANDRREQLSALVKDAYAGDQTWAWVRDFDDTTVWFDVEDPEGAGTYAQTYTTTNDVATALTGDRVEVRVQTTYVPVTAPTTESAPSVPSRPAGRTTEESEEDAMPQIEEARLRQLETDAGRATVLESERDTALKERDAAKAELATERKRTELRPTIAHVVAESEALPAALRDELVGHVVESITADDTTDTAKAKATEALKAEETRVAAIAEMLGAGKPRGLGGKPAAEGDEPTQADVDEAAARAFGHTIKEA